MTQLIEGVVQSLWTKQKTSKAGNPFTLHYANVDGTEVCLGFRNEENIEKGESVSLNVEEKFGELQVVSGKSTHGSSGAVNTTIPKSGDQSAKLGRDSRGYQSAFPVPKNTKDISICRQSSLNRAIELVQAFPSSFLGKDDDYEYLPSSEEITEAVISLAYEFTDFVTGHREEKAAEEIQKVQAQYQKGD